MSQTDRSGQDPARQPHVRVPIERCALARAVGEIGDGWILLILREVLCGATRFEAMREELGISRGVLAERLRLGVARELLIRRPVREPGRRVHHAYELTDKGRALLPALVALRGWSDAWLAGDEPSRLRMRTREGREVRVRLVDEEGRDVDPADVVVSAADPPRRRRADRPR